MARITLRLPDAVHEQLVRRARGSGTSLNQAIVDILRDVLGCGKGAPPDETLKERERRLLREALGDRVVDVKPEDYAPLFHRWYTPEERDAILKSMPVLDPPLSAAIIQEREESPY